MTKTTQKHAVLNALKGGPKTIWQLTEGLRISRPGARIFELKREGQPITDAWKEIQGRRAKVYTLEGYGGHSGSENGSVSELERTPIPVACAECGQGVVRSPKARPKQGEFAFCTDAHRSKFHRRKKSPTSFQDAPTGNPQDLPSTGNGARGL